MWLVDVDTYELRFFANPPLEYAILSHTWGEDEVLFQDMKNPVLAQHKAGWLKIQFTCDQARKNRYKYAWVDTCCIDKSSSAELSEAINSMFAWYHGASCCYAYLDDFEVPPATPYNNHSEFEITRDGLGQCRWFTRGWTLQELIAPSEIIFYGVGWVQLGTKETLRHLLADITGVDEDVLELMEHMFGIPVGRRMSWAAHRETTRDEDTAYCLLGLFGVNMPMLYGEGEKAFLRLQEEILKQHHDASLFAWRQGSALPSYRGLLAQCPAEFAHCAHLVSRTDGFFSRSRMTLTADGLSIAPRPTPKEEKKISVVPRAALPEVEGLELMQVFDFGSRDRRGSRRVGIRLQRFGDAYVRAKPDVLESPARFTTCFDAAGGSNLAGGSPYHIKTTLTTAIRLYRTHAPETNLPPLPAEARPQPRRAQPETPEADIPDRAGHWRQKHPRPESHRRLALPRDSTGVPCRYGGWRRAHLVG